MRLMVAWRRHRLHDLDLDLDDLVLLGAELNAEMEHQTARDTTLAAVSRSARGGRAWPTQSPHPLKVDVGRGRTARRSAGPSTCPLCRYRRKAAE